MKSLFTQLLIIFYAIMSGHVLFALIAVFQLHAGAGEVQTGYEMFLYIAAAVTIFSIGGAYLVYRNKIAVIQKMQAHTDKLMEWRTASIIKFALLEMPCLLNIVFLILTNDRMYLYMYVLVAVIMLLNKPVKYKVVEDLHLQSEDF